MGAFLHLFFLAAALTPAEPVHRMNVDFVGPLAEVTVERTVDAGDKATERILDLDLPAGAALVDVGVTEAGQNTRLVASAETTARATYASALAASGLVPTRVSVDPSTNLRLHFATAPTSRLLVRYRYTAPVVCSGGRFALHIPPTLEDNPVAAQVHVRFKDMDLQEATVVGAPVRMRGRSTQVTATAPARAAWEITFRLKDHAGPFPAQILAARARGARRPGQKAGDIVSLALCRPERKPDKVSPQNVLLLVDRSRSVGQGGMSGQRAVARALLEALPASVRFNALFFARATEPLFSLPRAATREAIEQLVSRADPNQLENGTHLAAALQAGASLLAVDPPAQGQKNWLVLISDGSVADGESGEKLAAALGKALRGSTDFVGLLTRPAADDPVPGESMAKVERAAQVLGGMVRVASSDDVPEAVHQVLATMGQGGDLLGVLLNEQALAGGVAPGAGVTKILHAPSRARLALQATMGTAVVRGSADASLVAAEWAQPLAESQNPRAWSPATGHGAFFVEAVTPVTSAADNVVRGQMDPTVLRNALSLAYMPRVRACYLTRQVKTAADFGLRGRMRLELQLERGELLEAVVRRSDLGHAEVEACVREAAYAIEYPRPMFRDAPTVAALNLVFRPRTPEEKPAADASALDREIDLILGPVTFDPNALVDMDAESP